MSFSSRARSALAGLTLTGAGLIAGMQLAPARGSDSNNARPPAATAEAAAADPAEGCVQPVPADQGPSLADLRRRL